MQAAGPDPWPGGCECGGGDTMNALAVNDFEAADLHGSKVKTAGSLGVSRATIYRKIHQYGIITPAS
jgi:hypothetical protein